MCHFCRLHSVQFCTYISSYCFLFLCYVNLGGRCEIESRCSSEVKHFLSNEISFVKLREIVRDDSLSNSANSFHTRSSSGWWWCLFVAFSGKKTSVSQTPAAVWTKQTETSGNTVVMDFCPLEFHALRQILRHHFFWFWDIKNGKLNLNLKLMSS